MPIARINGVDLHYEVAGQGDVVVFLHGYTGSSQDWANQTRGLSAKYRVIALDIRGHGKSAAPRREEEYSVPIFTNDVLGLLKILNIRRCCLVGHSLGGSIALQFALERQAMLAAVVLVDTSSGAYTRAPNYAQSRQKLDELACSQGMEAVFDFEVANNPTRKERIQKHPELKEVMRRKMLMTSVDGYIYVSKAIEKWAPVASRLAEIKVPTLIFWGEEDLAFTEAVQVLKAGITGSELVAVKGVGHSPHEEAPDFFNETLLGFLNRIKW